VSVQAIGGIDQYAAAATGIRDFFLNGPPWHCGQGNARRCAVTIFLSVARAMLDAFAKNGPLRCSPRNVSDELTVPLFRKHHQKLHRHGNEATLVGKNANCPRAARKRALQNLSLITLE